MNILTKVLYIPLILYLLHTKLIFSLNWTDDIKIPEIDERDRIEPTMCPEEFEDFCNKKSNNLENLFSTFFKKKYGIVLSKNKRLSAGPLHDSLNNGPCQCGMTFRAIDLGSGVFPRFFHTGVCKKNTCGVFHRCQPKKYKVRILKRKNVDSEPYTELQEIHESAFPESLQEDWIPDYVNIVVGCECLPKKI